MEDQDSEVRKRKKQETDTITGEQETAVIACPFERYVVLVELGPAGEFVGIAGVSIKKDFLSHQQQLRHLASLPSTDVDSFYLESEEEEG